MLPAEKQENESTTAVASANTAAPSGFGKVLGSIYGLQQRLNDLTLEDVTAAEINLRSLMQQIALLRDLVGHVAELKNTVANANHLIDSIPEENINLVGPDSLEKHTKLHAIVRASKLIRFQRVMKAARASADAVSFDAVAGMLHIDTAAPNSMPPALPQEIIQEETKVAPDIALAATASHVQLEAIDSGQGIVIEAPREWTFEAAKNKSPNSSTPADEIEPNFALVNGDGSAADEGSAKIVDKAHAVIENSAPVSPAEFPTHAPLEAPITVETSKVALIQSAENFPSSDAWPINPAAKTAISELEKPRHLSRKQKKLAKNKLLTDAESKLDESKALVPANSIINQRLLNDLIESYGDFATTPNLPAPLQASLPPKVRSVEATVLATSGLDNPAKPNRSSTDLKRDGELDRQLKKIIKDYGEYDLYSRQSPINLKTGGVAVFVVLGLVLAGLYLFKAPTTAPSSPPHAVTQPSQAAPGMSPDTSSNDERNRSAAKSGNREEAAATAITVTKQKK